MARSTHAVGSAVIQREESVVARGQRCGDPRCRRVTRRACSGPSSRYMIGIRCPCKVCCVAGITCRRGSREDVIDVAFHAIHCCVRARQRERRVVVIECRSSPCRRGVASVACRRKSRRGMIRIRRAIPISLVAPVTRRRQRRVVVVCMALRARNRGVSASQWERRVVVIERRRAPRTRRMADRAICRESRSHVIRDLLCR